MVPPDAGGTSLTRHCAVMAWAPRELIDAVTFCTQYGRVNEPEIKITLHSGTIQATSQRNRVRTEADATLEKMLDPIAGSAATEKSVAGIIDLFVDDLFGTSGTEMEHRVLARLGMDFHIGSEDWNDVLFTRPKHRWTKDTQSGPCIEVSQEKAVEELEVIQVERSTKEVLHCIPAMHTRYRSLSGTDKLVAELATVSVLLPVSLMCFKGSFSNNS